MWGISWQTEELVSFSRTVLHGVSWLVGSEMINLTIHFLSIRTHHLYSGPINGSRCSET